MTASRKRSRFCHHKTVATPEIVPQLITPIYTAWAPAVHKQFSVVTHVELRIKSLICLLGLGFGIRNSAKINHKPLYCFATAAGPLQYINN